MPGAHHRVSCKSLLLSILLTSSAYTCCRTSARVHLSGWYCTWAGTKGKQQQQQHHQPEAPAGQFSVHTTPHSQDRTRWLQLRRARA
jgi:hypothetical protein